MQEQVRKELRESKCSSEFRVRSIFAALFRCYSRHCGPPSAPAGSLGSDPLGPAPGPRWRDWLGRGGPVGEGSAPHASSSGLLDGTKGLAAPQTRPRGLRDRLLQAVAVARVAEPPLGFLLSVDPQASE